MDGWTYRHIAYRMYTLYKGRQCCQHLHGSLRKGTCWPHTTRRCTQRWSAFAAGWPVVLSSVCVCVCTRDISTNVCMPTQCSLSVYVCMRCQEVVGHNNECLQHDQRNDERIDAGRHGAQLDADNSANQLKTASSRRSICLHCQLHRSCLIKYCSTKNLVSFRSLFPTLCWLCSSSLSNVFCYIDIYVYIQGICQNIHDFWPSRMDPRDLGFETRSSPIIHEKTC